MIPFLWQNLLTASCEAEILAGKMPRRKRLLGLLPGCCPVGTPWLCRPGPCPSLRGGRTCGASEVTVSVLTEGSPDALQNPCYIGTHGCDTNAACQPGPGSQFTCECSIGFRGDGRTCYGTAWLLAWGGGVSWACGGGHTPGSSAAGGDPAPEMSTDGVPLGAPSGMLGPVQCTDWKHRAAWTERHTPRRREGKLKSAPFAALRA